MGPFESGWVVGHNSGFSGSREIYRMSESRASKGFSDLLNLHAGGETGVEKDTF